MNAKIRTLAAAIATTAGIALAPAAQAATPSQIPDGCAIGRMCGYTATEYQGTRTSVAGSNQSFPDDIAYIGFRQARSVFNNGSRFTAEDGSQRGHCVTVYDHENYTGKSLVIKPGEGIRTLPEEFGQIRSNRWTECTLP